MAHMGKLIGSVGRATRAYKGELGNLDVTWLFGPHPISIAFAAAARRRNAPILLCVRQNLPRYIAGRVSPVNRLWAVPIAWANEIAFRLLARRAATVVVGAELAEIYSAGSRPNVQQITISLVRAADVASEAAALGRDWDGEELRAVSVGRLDPEKNPLLMVDVIEALHRRDARWRLDVIGDGPLAGALAERTREAGLEGVLRLHGHVPHGAELTRRYDEAHALLHVSFTEGMPQVLIEAAASGLPIVATDVGGVRAALRGGEAGLLMPPGSADAAVTALERLRDEPGLRESLVRSSLAVAHENTIEHSHDEIIRMIQYALRAEGGKPSDLPAPTVTETP
jgi:glycosyltransferase involved in cell wall biosynthesis